VCRSRGAHEGLALATVENICVPLCLGDEAEGAAASHATATQLLGVDLRTGAADIVNAGHTR
jgi:hypothetical protein